MEWRDVPGGLRERSVKPRLLLVDDEPSLLEMLSLILERHGFAVSAAESVPAALLAMADHQFDLLLTDLSMPGDGFTVVREMHRLQPQASLLVLSGFAGAWQRAPSDVRGMVAEYIAKPADIPSLIEILRHHAPPPLPL